MGESGVFYAGCDCIKHPTPYLFENTSCTDCLLTCAKAPNPLENSKPDDHELKKNLELLSHEFITALPGQLGTIEGDWVRVRRNGWDPKAIETLTRQLHPLSGIAATLGYEKIAKSASQLKTLLETKNNGNGCNGSEHPLSKAES
jgi:HPt (histidine-containing phosphotransfer) domain-containing protein